MGVGAAGVAVPDASVVMLVGLEVRLLAVKVKGPPKEPAVIFCKLSVAGFGVLVKVQTIFAKGLRLVARIVMVLPAKLPKLAGFPVVPELVSVQLKLDNVKFVLAASVSVTGLLILVTELLFTVVGAAVPAVIVVILAGVPAKFVAVNVNGPPGKPVVIF